MTTNEEYRKLRGTDKPFTASPEEVQRRWLRLRAQRRKAAGLSAQSKPKSRRWGDRNPDPDASWDEQDD
jgi:hypothetical protein